MTPETVDDFLKSTCVIIVFAYLLTRRPLQAVGRLGALFGIAGLVELWVARERSPYDTYTLIITFVSLRFGGRIGGLAALLVGAGAPLFLHEHALIRTWVALGISLGAGVVVRRTVEPHRMGLACLLAISLAEVGAILARTVLHSQQEIPFSLPLALLKLVTNGLGALVLQTVVSDAEARQRAEALRIEVERNRTRLVESQLAALQARVHPHFLFNALTSIAALCRIAPHQAQATIVQLGQLMRRALESTPRSLVPLHEELEAVDSYLQLETLRLGERLQVTRAIDPACLEALVPPFSLQTLVENAVLHGIGPCPEPASLHLRVSRHRRGILVLVADRGAGMDAQQLARARSPWSEEVQERHHGLQIAREQLVLLLGPAARLRLFSRVNQGTLALFLVPTRPKEVQ